jgi:hypothetical protein
MEAVSGYKPSFWRRAGHAVAKEFMHVLPAVLFFAAGFNLIVLSMNLALAAYFIRFSSFMVATGSALIVGKVVLVADQLPFLRRFDTAPLIRPILFKTIVYWALVFVARIIEAFVKYWISSGHAAGFLQYLADHFSWYRFAFIQIWILVLFLIYTTGAELNALFGQDELYKLMFLRGSTKAKLSRRQRIRALVHLNRLTARYTEEEIKDAHSPAHAALVDDIITLVRDKG